MKTQEKQGQTFCVWCDGALGKVKFRDVADRLGFVEGRWNLIECNKCKSLILSPYPSAAEVSKYYPPNYNIPTPSNFSGIRRVLSSIEHHFLGSSYQQEVFYLSRVLPVFEKKLIKILEIGCGSGNRLEFLHRLGFDVTGVDWSKADVDGMLSRGLKAFCLDIDSLTKYFEPESFDVIMSFDVLEHIPDLGSFFEKVTRLLKPGGWMVAGLPAQDCYAIKVLGKEWTALREVPRHVSIPSLKGATILFERFGFRNTKIFPYSSLSCSIVLGNSFVPNSSASNFYSGSFKVWTLVKRLVGAVITLLSAPLFFLENRFTNHPSRFVIYGQKY